MRMYAKHVLRGLLVTVRMILSSAFTCFLAASFLPAQQKQTSASPSDRILLGRMTTGPIVSFARTASGYWGIEISLNNAPCAQQPHEPVELFVDRQRMQQQQ